MLLNRLFRSAKSRPSAPRARTAARLSLEALDDRIVPATLSVGDATLVEGNAGTAAAAVVVSLDAPSNRTVTVNYRTANGTAAAGSDFQTASGKLTFVPGETSKTILVPVIGDRLGEGNETFSVNLSSARHAKIADGRGVVTIVDDEPRIVVNGNGWVVEGDSGTTLVTFTVSLSAPYDEVVTVNYFTQDGTALAGEDYLATSGMLTFAPGETSKTITVEVIGDTHAEITGYNSGPVGREEFYINLGNASTNGLLIDNTFKVTIADNDIGEQPPDDGCDIGC